jgi:hypothetical protein
MNLKYNTLSEIDNLIRTDEEKVYAILSHLCFQTIKIHNDGLIEIGCFKTTILSLLCRGFGYRIDSNKIDVILNDSDK